MIRAVSLPDGHTPPNGPGGARPNEAEIPEHLRPLWQSLSNLPTPIPAMQQAIRIQIPSIDVDAPVVQGDNWEQLKKGGGSGIGLTIAHALVEAHGGRIWVESAGEGQGSAFTFTLPIAK